MKNNVQLYKPVDGQPDIAPVLRVLRDQELSKLIHDMYCFGIQRITVTPRSAGLMSIVKATFMPSDDQPPEELAVARDRIVRWWAERMPLTGIMDVESVPDAEDIKKQQTFWQHLKGRPEEIKPGDQRRIVPLNIEADPGALPDVVPYDDVPK